MALCPRCQTELPKDSGFVLCPNCGHPSVLDIDGNLVQKSETPASEFQEQSPSALLSHEEPSEPAIASLDFNQVQEKSSHEEASSDFSFFKDEPQEEPPSSQNDNFMKLPQISEGLGISESLTQYANSELSQGKDGAFVYNVSISDIDSKEIREFLREAISDTRFNWDAKLIISQIQKGELLLKNLSPVKASILINRIKRLPVKIRWEQYAITQAEQDIPSF